MYLFYQSPFYITNFSSLMQCIHLSLVILGIHLIICLLNTRQLVHCWWNWEGDFTLKIATLLDTT